MEEVEFEKSETAVVNYFRVSVSTVWFTRRVFGGEMFKIFHGKESGNPEFAKVIEEKVNQDEEMKSLIHNWLEEGAVHLIRRRYLDCVVFYICKDKNNPFGSLIESYEWVFKYSPSGDFEEKEIKESKLRNFYSVLFMSVNKSISQKELPKTRYIGMFYKYNDLCPIGYDLGEFAKNATELSERYVFKKESTRRKFVTGYYGKFHRVEIYVRTKVT